MGGTEGGGFPSRSGERPAPVLLVVAVNHQGPEPLSASGNRTVRVRPPEPDTTSVAAGRPVGTAILSWATSQSTTARRSNSECASVPPIGSGKPGRGRRQFTTAARPTPAIRPTSAGSTLSSPGWTGTSATSGERRPVRSGRTAANPLTAAPAATRQRPRRSTAAPCPYSVSVQRVRTPCRPPSPCPPGTQPSRTSPHQVLDHMAGCSAPGQCLDMTRAANSTRVGGSIHRGNDPPDARPAEATQAIAPRGEDPRAGSQPDPPFQAGGPGPAQVLRHSQRGPTRVGAARWGRRTTTGTQDGRRSHESARARSEAAACR